MFSPHQISTQFELLEILLSIYPIVKLIRNALWRFRTYLLWLIGALFCEILNIWIYDGLAILFQNLLRHILDVGVNLSSDIGFGILILDECILPSHDRVINCLVDGLINHLVLFQNGIIERDGFTWLQHIQPISFVWRTFILNRLKDLLKLDALFAGRLRVEI